MPNHISVKRNEETIEHMHIAKGLSIMLGIWSRVVKAKLLEDFYPYALVAWVSLGGEMDRK